MLTYMGYKASSILYFLLLSFIFNDDGGTSLFTFSTLDMVVMDEICDNGIDDDGDGLIDNFDPDCQSGPLECYEFGVEQDSTAFIPQFKCVFDHPFVVAYAPPLFADIDNDGETEVVALTHFQPDGFIVINTNTCELEYEVSLSTDVNNKAGGMVLGDVDADGFVDIFVPTGLNVERWEYNSGSGQIEQIWSVGPCATALRKHLDIWDINQDGTPEIIPNGGNMVDAISGFVYPGSLPPLDPEGKGLYAFSADGDMSAAPNEGPVELITGTSAYRYNFSTQNWVLARSHPTVSWGPTSGTSLADVDLDGDLDAVAVDYVEGKALIWDIQTDELLGGGIWDYPDTLGGRANITNIDDDDFPEFIFTTRFNMYIVDDISQTGLFGEVIWREQTSDFSGHTQVTSFDFDKDGEYEIVYRDEQELRIFRGSGSGVADPPFPSGPLELMTSGFGSCISGTGMEYPTIGDVDQDDQAEIVVSCESSISIIESGDFPWANATPVWNTQAFNITNVNEDGTIPSDPVENYTIYNNFLAQISFDTQEDSIPIPVADLYAEILSVVEDCTSDASVTMRICNQGDNISESPLPFAYYDGDPRDTGILINVLEFNQSLDIGECVEYTFDLTGIPGGDIDIFLVLNDDGSVPTPYDINSVVDGGNFPMTIIHECNYPNNLVIFPISNAPALTNISDSICEGDFYDFYGTPLSSAGVYEETITGVDGCDSTFVLTLTVNIPSTSNINEIICEGDVYNFNGQLISQTGVYTSTLINNVGCDSLITLDLTSYENTSSEINMDICPGDDYDFNGTLLSLPGTYWDTLSNSNGCDSIITLNLDNHPIPVENLDVGICDGDTYNFNGQIITSPGNYSATLVSQFGCDSIVNLQLSFTNLVAVSFGASICPGDQYNFNGEMLASPGVYVDTFITGTGCDSLMTLTLDYYPQAFPEESIILCEGETFEIGGVSYSEPNVVIDSSFLNGECLITTYSIDVIPETYIIADNVTTCPGDEVELFADSNGDIIWLGHPSLSCIDCPNPTVTVDETTEITIESVTCQGDPFSRIITVEVEDVNIVEITGDSLLVKGKSGIYNSTSEGIPQAADWYFDGELVCGACPSFEYTPIHSGTLIAQSFDGGPCLQSDTLLIDVRNDCSIIDAVIPNIITPNGDGANDVLRAELDNYAEFVVFRIYDRWGGLMFESNDPDFMWDGTYLGKSLNPGVYSYYFQVKCLNEKITVIKGNVTLLR